VSKILFYTDLHLDNWSAFSKTTDSGHNSRFLEQIKVMRGLLEYAKEHDCKVVFGGDLFNRRLLVPSDVLHLTYEVVEMYRDVTQYFLIGNHDMYSWNPDDTPLATFSGMPHVQVITAPTGVYAGGDVDLILIPHGALIPASPTTEGYKILVTHYVGPKDFRMKDDLTVKQLKALGYDLIMLGHIHKPQALADNIIVMGSPMAHSFHEANEEKYFYVFDIEDKELVKYPTNAPQFLTHEVKTKTELKKLKLTDKDYHRVNVLSSKITISDLTPIIGHNVIISRVAEELEGKEPVITDKVKTPKDEVNEYYENLETDLDKAELKARAMDVVNAY
jgi:DNA repair exonuclease SbcCD nuclease subunit